MFSYSLLVCSPACDTTHFKTCTNSTASCDSPLKLELPLNSNTLSDDSNQLQDCCPSASLSPQKTISSSRALVSRNSTPVDNDYGSLVAESLSGTVNFVEHSLDCTTPAGADLGKHQLVKGSDASENNSDRTKYVFVLLG